jgi:hypothetical protein
MPVRPQCRLARAWLALAAAGVAACSFAPGDRFGAPVTDSTLLRVGVPRVPHELDPARVRTFEEQLLARALFATLVEVDADGAHPGLATTWEVLDGGKTLRFHLEPGAHFTDGAPLAAHDVVWSWQRALKKSTAAADPAALAVVQNGKELVRGELLRVAQAGARVDKEPFAVFAAKPDARPPPGATLPAGTPVKVIDTNARVSCCNARTSLLDEPHDTAGALAVLGADEIATVLAIEDVEGERWLRLRAPAGGAGWARAAGLVVAVPPVSLRRVVERGAASLALLAGPDDSAPVRDSLEDDDTVELIERGPEFSLVLSARTGRAGWLRSTVLDDVVGERWRFHVAPQDGALASGWLEANDLVLDPGLLAARAVDATTLEVDLAAPVEDALRAFASPALAPVPARTVDELGFAWSQPARIVTSGPFALASIDSSRAVLVASDTSFERDRTSLAKVEIVTEPDPLFALHLFRAGRLDALLDGLLPKDLFPALSHAQDFVGDGHGGALVALEVKGVDPARPDLRRVSIADDESEVAP